MRDERGGLAASPTLESPYGQIQQKTSYDKFLAGFREAARPARGGTGCQEKGEGDQ
jgi:hypothetical protein